MLSNHPNVHSSARQWSEDQTLHIACAYVNPLRSDRRREMALDFKFRMQRTPNVVLHMGELAYGDRPFEVTGDDPNDVQLRTHTELFHKENIGNIVVSRFPAGWKYGGLLDGDFTMTRHDWALEAIHQLQHHEWVQLFSSYIHESGDHRPIRPISAFAYNYVNRRPEMLEWTRHEADNLVGSTHSSGLQDNQKWPGVPGATGGGWAFTRHGFNTVGGFLDTCVLGSGDWHMAFGLVGITITRAELEKCTSSYAAFITAWAKRAEVLKANIGYVDNMAVHHFHGSYVNRGYGNRSNILIDEALCPINDLSRDWQGILQFNDNKPRLRDKIRAYFRSRKEDDMTLRGNERHLI